MSDLNYVLDTNAILDSWEIVFSYPLESLVILDVVLEELDTFKGYDDSRGYNARQFLKWFETELDKKRLYVSGCSYTSIHDPVDEKILKSLQSYTPNVLVTSDRLLRCKAKARSLRAEAPVTNQARENVHTVNVSQVLIDTLYREERVCDTFHSWDELPHSEMLLNDWLILKHGSQSALAQFKSGRIIKVEDQTVFGLSALNAEQAMALHALMDQSTPCVVLRGLAGSGKTLLSLAAAFQQRSQYEQIYYTRPVVALGNRDLGYLPGGMEEKMDPYMQPLFDSLKFLRQTAGTNEKKIQDMTDGEGGRRKLEMLPLPFIRGRTLHRRYVILDETQNCSPLEVRTMMTRMGKEAKLVLLGDPSQSDLGAARKAKTMNQTIQRLDGDPLFAWVEFNTCHRSALAALAAERL